MLELNKVMVIGRLTRDAEVRYVTSGVAVANFDIAVNRRYKDTKTGENTDEVCYLTVKAWRKLAEFVEQYLGKGKGVFVEGRLQQENWEKDGQKRSKIVILADRITFAESRAEQDARGGGSAGAPAYAGAGSRGGADSDSPPSDMPPMPGGEPGGDGGSTDDDLPF
jgi:single-strand DNA-binding protein